MVTNFKKKYSSREGNTQTIGEIYSLFGINFAYTIPQSPDNSAGISNAVTNRFGQYLQR